MLNIVTYNFNILNNLSRGVMVPSKDSIWIFRSLSLARLLIQVIEGGQRQTVGDGRNSVHLDTRRLDSVAERSQILLFCTLLYTRSDIQFYIVIINAFSIFIYFLHIAHSNLYAVAVFFKKRQT